MQNTQNTQPETIKTYIPDKGDCVWIDFNPTVGHEQRGRRPAVVVSTDVFNNKTGLAYVCPITSTEKNYPYRIKLSEPNLQGFVMVEQLKSVDWSGRNAEYICKLSGDVLISVINCTRAIMDIT
jgi:mRNA interferase MazF